MKLTAIVLPLRIFGLEYESDNYFGVDFYELPGMILGFLVLPASQNTSGLPKHFRSNNVTQRSVLKSKKIMIL